MTTIIELINDKIKLGDYFYSFEFFPPRTDEGVVNLFARFDRMAESSPLFIDVTWSAGGAKKDTPNPTPDIVKQAQELCCLITNMHLTCNTASKDEIRNILQNAKNNGIRNILALRGDPPRGNQKYSGDFKYAVELVRFMREEFGDYFCISVAGYPYGHPDCTVDADNLIHLKQKVDAGADFIVSQLFFEAEDFIRWVADCRAIGITCPIIPGILPIQGYASLRNITKMSCITVPASILRAIEPIKDDDAAVREVGIKLAVEMCQKLMAAGILGFHFYTLNREIATLQIVKELKLTKCFRELPWRKPPSEKRRKEDVRPIYWANRSKSYVSRTEDWDDFPNGRWGDSSSPAFGDLTDYHIFLHSCPEKPEERRKIWGDAKSIKSITEVFVNFLEGKIKELPWIEGGISQETNRIQEHLVRLNRAGFWTINSQPRVNGVPSSDPEVGWGGAGGVVYQKAYIEFFASPLHVKSFINVVKGYGNRFNYQLSNYAGDYESNLTGPMAVTWGLFPGKQVIQPTIVDPVSFKVWKDEAFQIWTSKWASIYEEEPPTIREILHSYYLVNIVDNDYVQGDIFDVTSCLLQNIENLIMVV